MIHAPLEQADRYAALHPDLSAAIAYLRSRSLRDLPTGRIDISKTVYAVVARSPARRRSDAPLEAHRRFIDVQCVIAGVEEMGWSPRSACQRPQAAYDTERDIEFFGDDAECYLTVRPGQFVVFFPEDAHAPLIGTGEIHKVVVKVPV